nr:MAG: redox-regulated ATPase YchF [Chloroflexota bacterium]
MYLVVLFFFHADAGIQVGARSVGSEMLLRKKTIYAQVTYVDIGGLDKGVSEGGLRGPLRNELAQLDGFVHVVRAFSDENVPHPYGDVDPARDLEILDQEFLLSDLVSVETRLGKIEEELRRKGRTAGQAIVQEKELMERLRAALEAEQPLRDLGLTEAEIKSLRGYGFLTLKPTLVVLNTDEAGSAAEDALHYDHASSAVVSLQGKIEAELAQLPEDDAALFMEEYGITELSAARVIRLSYQLLNIQSFFTVGEDEVRAWSVRVGATAPEAAGVIHSDLQKGFIRAEVMAYDDLIALGSEAAMKQAGKLRLEGKDYIVKDGDIVHIRSGL